MKAFYLTMVAATFALSGIAQNSIRPNIYLQDMQYYNPASVAIDSTQSLQITIYTKYEWVDNDKDIWNKPMNIWLSHAARIGKTNSFYTLSYVNDAYSFFNRNALYIGYVRQKKLGKTSSLSYGGRVVANMDVIKWNKLQLPHSEGGNSLRFNPDLDLGVSYQYKKFTAGVGIKNIIGSSTKIENATLLKNHREVNVNLSYQQNIGKKFSVTPFLLLANERSTLIDAGLSFSAFKFVSASYTLRVNELKSVITLNVDVDKHFSVGIAYDRSDLVSDNNFDFVLRYRR